MLQMTSTAFEKTPSLTIGCNQRKCCSKSKLEKHIDILSVLSCKYPMNLEQIMQHIELNFDIAIDLLSFLVKLNMVEEGNYSQGVTYSITEKGKRAAHFFKNQSCIPQF
jgi:predicted transcriptional regulator